MDPDVTVEPRAGGPGFTIAGDPGPDDGPALRALLLGLAPTDGALELELLDLDLDHGVVVACCVQAVDALRARGVRLVLHHAPQMLAHTLYKVGRLGDPDLVLVAPRHDTGFGAS